MAAAVAVAAISTHIPPPIYVCDPPPPPHIPLPSPHYPSLYPPRARPLPYITQLATPSKSPPRGASSQRFQLGSPRRPGRAALRRCLEWWTRRGRVGSRKKSSRRPPRTAKTDTWKDRTSKVCRHFHHCHCHGTIHWKSQHVTKEAIENKETNQRTYEQTNKQPHCPSPS